MASDALNISIAPRPKAKKRGWTVSQKADATNQEKKKRGTWSDFQGNCEALLRPFLEEYKMQAGKHGKCQPVVDRATRAFFDKYPWFLADDMPGQLVGVVDVDGNVLGFSPDEQDKNGEKYEAYKKEVRKAQIKKIQNWLQYHTQHETRHVQHHNPMKEWIACMAAKGDHKPVRLPLYKFYMSQDEYKEKIAEKYADMYLTGLKCKKAFQAQCDIARDLLALEDEDTHAGLAHSNDEEYEQHLSVWERCLEPKINGTVEEDFQKRCRENIVTVVQLFCDMMCAFTGMKVIILMGDAPKEDEPNIPIAIYEAEKCLAHLGEQTWAQWNAKSLHNDVGTLFAKYLIHGMKYDPGDENAKPSLKVDELYTMNEVASATSVSVDVQNAGSPVMKSSEKTDPSDSETVSDSESDKEDGDNDNKEGDNDDDGEDDDKQSDEENGEERDEENDEESEESEDEDKMERPEKRRKLSFEVERQHNIVRNQKMFEELGIASAVHNMGFQHSQEAPKAQKKVKAKRKRVVVDAPVMMTRHRATAIGANHGEHEDTHSAQFSREGMVRDNEVQTAAAEMQPSPTITSDSTAAASDGMAYDAAPRTQCSLEADKTLKLHDAVRHMLEMKASIITSKHTLAGEVLPTSLDAEREHLAIDEPDWIKQVRPFLKLENPRGCWERLVDDWIVMERATKFRTMILKVIQKTGFTKQKHPAAVELWAKNKCQPRGEPTKDGVENVQDFVRSIIEWWAYLQSLGDGQAMLCPRQNGMLSVLALLKWWQVLAPEQLGLDDVLADVHDIVLAITQIQRQHHGGLMQAASPIEGDRLVSGLSWSCSRATTMASKRLQEAQETCPGCMIPNADVVTVAQPHPPLPQPKFLSPKPPFFVLVALFIIIHVSAAKLQLLEALAVRMQEQHIPLQLPEVASGHVNRTAAN
ncbi:hypothetical protein FISHEDRAFT_54927 [Fistulina hepatica ATCC 64428]|uniref:Uncharacterized protein n=1 Tax=Fistulina hepatica ATCC 64428 TaxID=1128425 RepID=A0A0D7AR58_9AGAR|nr:hypothetical protein FISHEDRAFT_54927 [Fistulina hepatica ATCC 64428]